jgi:hypothetical protein
MFNLGDGAARQARTATNIINGATAPASPQSVFGPSTAWIDYASIDDGWK